MSSMHAADQGQVQGRIVKVKPQGDGTLRFEIVCHNSRGRVAHREKFYLPPKSPLKELVLKGELAHVSFLKTGRDRDLPIDLILIVREDEASE